MEFSIIIPCINELENLRELIPLLKEALNGVHYEIIVADGGSSDKTRTIVDKMAHVIVSPKKGRATQLNYGAKYAKGKLLYFVHADARPPKDFYQQIIKARKENYEIGSFRFKFDDNSGLRKINSYCTRFDLPFCRGGDQTLFITRRLFDELKGFKEDYIIMEDYDIIGRARKDYPFKIIQDDVIVSARKYEDNSWLRVQFSNLTIFTMYRLGCFSQESMYKTYKRMLNYR